MKKTFRVEGLKRNYLRKIHQKSYGFLHRDLDVCLVVTSKVRTTLAVLSAIVGSYGKKDLKAIQSLSGLTNKYTV